MEISTHANVNGPDAILGSSLRACRIEGMLSPKKHAQQRTSRMLTPMTSAAATLPRHIQAIRPTMAPQDAPSRTAVAASRRNARRYQERVSRIERRDWIARVMD